MTELASPYSMRRTEKERWAPTCMTRREPRNVMLSSLSRYRWSLSLSCLHPRLTVVKMLLADAMWQL